MMNKGTIITDVDGVLLDWMAMFTRWMKEKGATPNINTCYSLAKRYDCTEKEINLMIEQFNRSAAMGFCPAYKNAPHFVKRLSEQDYRFVAVTAMGGDRYSEQLRVQNLERVFGRVFTNFHFLPLNAPKDDVLSLFSGTECWYVEDNLSYAEAGVKHGLRPILMRHDHNAHYDSEDMLSAESWSDVYKYITGENHL